MTKLSVAELPPGGCQVWWAGPEHARPEHLGLLNSAEVGRHERLQRPADRSRFLAAGVLLRAVVGGHLGCHPAEVPVTRVCRTCEQPHGKPAVPGSGLEVSISHAGDRVVVAVTRVAPVGVDVEQVTRRVDVDSMSRQVLAPAERAALAELPADGRLRGFFTYWTRKEALLKATGEGLATPMTSVQVSGADEPAALRAYASRPELVGHGTLLDLTAADGYAAALAVLGPLSLPVDIYDGAELLATLAKPEWGG